MSNSSGVTYIRDNQPFNSDLNAEASARIDKIQLICSRHLIELLQNMFDGIDDSFFELANNARTNNEQNLYFEAMREIRIKRKSIENCFEENIKNLFLPSSVLRQKTESSKTKEIDFESLSLVNKDDLEERVAISSMSSKAASNFQGPLLQFQTRAANLYGITDLSNISAPLNPEDISKEFSAACSMLEINLKERLIVYKQFDRYVLSNLGYVLDEANKYLIKSGILPDLKSSIIKQKPSPKGETASSPLESPATTYPNTNTQTILPQLQSLLANIRNQTQAHSKNAASDSSYSENTFLIETKDLISILSTIQNSSQFESSNPKVVDIHSHIRSHFQHSPAANKKQPVVKQLDEDLINLVAMLFEFILEDYNLEPSIQVLISRLQIPILKVVIKDSSFFSTNKHPARKLLNSLAKAGIGWTENVNSTHDALYLKIQDIVNTILNKFDGDIKLFTLLNKDFDDFMNKEEKKSKIVEQRTKESEKGLLKSKQAQKAVDDFLQTIISDAHENLPPLVEETLTQGWTRVMFLAYLKDDQEHQWTKTCQAAQDLIWCLKPISSQKDRQHWISIAPKLLKTLKNGLQDVSFHSNNLDSTITEIRTLLTSTFKQNIFNDQDNQATYSSASKLINDHPNSAVEKQLAFNNLELQKYSNIIDDLTLGTWLEFKLNSNKKIRCKLSTIIEEADTLIFVNRLGLKSLEKSKEELANDLHKKNAIILEQALLIDRAMSAVTSSLKQKASA